MGLIIPDVWALLEQITKSMDYQGSRTLGYQVSAGVPSRCWGYQERKNIRPAWLEQATSRYKASITVSRSSN